MFRKKVEACDNMKDLLSSYRRHVEQVGTEFSKLDQSLQTTNAAELRERKEEEAREREHQFFLDVERAADQKRRN